MKPAARLAIVVVYVVVFWGALPLALFAAGRGVERALALDPLTPRPALGGALFVVGAALLVSAMIVLKTRGRGLPVSALPPPRLVVQGAYLACRHPIYLGFHVGLVGLALVFGEAGLALVVAPAFLPVWMGYALVEERGLVRRFGDEYRRYRRHVGLLPRLPLYRLAWLVGRVVLPVHREGAYPAGTFVVVSNHRSYLDPFFLALTMWRPLRFASTAEVFRVALLRPLLARARAVSVRRYRVDVVAAREVRRLVAEGERVGLFVEGERSVSGTYLGCPRDVARFARALGVPVVPVALVGAYDVGPRFSDVLRRRPVQVRVGAPLIWRGDDDARVVDDGIRALLVDDPPPVHLDGLPREKLARVLWACPRCFAEPFDVRTLACSACGLVLVPTTDGRLADHDDVRALAAWCAPLFARARAGESLVDEARLFVERTPFGAPRPLAPRGHVRATLSPSALVMGDVELPVHTLTRVTTERADTVEIARGVEMWQLVPTTTSAFRWCMAIEGHMRRARGGA